MHISKNSCNLKEISIAHQTFNTNEVQKHTLQCFKATFNTLIAD